ncbi:MAG: transglutaminase domain-containing protein [Terracidiphilus sp.]
MRTYTVLFLAASLVGVATPLVAYAQFQTPSKEELAMTSDPKAPGASAVILYREEREDEEHHFRSVYERVKVLTEAGKEAATVQVTYLKNFVFYAAGDNSSRMASGTANAWSLPDINHAGEDARIDTNAYGGKNEVSAIEGRVIHADGTIIPLTGAPADLLRKKEGNTQFNTLTFNLPGVEVGSIIEYRYQVRYDRFQQAPQWQVQQPYFIHHAHFLFQPANQFLPARTQGGSGVSNSAILDSHCEILTDIRSVNILPPGAEVRQDGQGYWFTDLHDIPAIPHEAYGPPLGDHIYQVNFFYTNTPDTKDFWQKEMSAWAKEVNQYTAATPSIKSAAAEATQGATTPLDKAKRLYATVQKLQNKDFEANAAPFLAPEFVPKGSVDTVLDSKSGNSEEMALLYLALARASGLEARPERIASRERRTFSLKFMDASQLDTVLIGVIIDGKEIVLDPGQKMAPFQTLLWSHAGAGGIALAGNGKVETIITPFQQNTDNMVVRVGSLNISPQGTISGSLKVGFTGQQALQWRQQAVRFNADEARQQLEKTIAAQVPDGIQIHIDRIASLDDPSKQLVAVVAFSGSLANHAGSHLVLPRLLFETKETDPFPPEESRMLPVDVHYPAEEQEQITYVLPSGFALEGAPKDINVKWEENAAYVLRTKADAGSITTGRVLAWGFTMLDASEYGKLRDFYDKLVLSDHEQIAFTATQAAVK